jgi:Flp pilus assembly pilin Flp
MRSEIGRWIRKALARTQDAQGLVEYGLILVLVSIAAIAIMSVLGTSVTSLYSQASSVFP